MAVNNMKTFLNVLHFDADIKNATGTFIGHSQYFTNIAT